MSGGNIYFTKVGRIVYFSYNHDIYNLAAKEPIKIAEIPVGMEPLYTYTVMNATSGDIQISMRTSGEIIAYNYGDEVSLKTCRFSGSYICKI